MGMKRITRKELKEMVKGRVLEAVGEIMGYHGSSANFDKFNHKKFLGTGAGSQVFGWGTYITSDYEIGKSYATITSNVDINNGDIQLNSSYDIYDYIDKAKYGGKEWKSIIEEIRNDLDMYFSNNVTGLIEALENGVSEMTLKMNRSYGIGAKKYQFQIDRIKKKIQLLNDLNFDKGQYLYEVNIPDDDGTNYLSWYDHVPREFMGRIYTKLFSLRQKYLDMMAERNYPFKSTLYQYAKYPDKEKLIDVLLKDDTYDSFFANSYYTNKKDGDGKDVYLRLQQLFGSPKAASLFLLQCGFVGIKYPAGTRMQKPEGAADDAMNYVIFNANDVKITNKTNVTPQNNNEG